MITTNFRREAAGNGIPKKERESAHCHDDADADDDDDDDDDDVLSNYFYSKALFLKFSCNPLRIRYQIFDILHFFVVYN